MVALKERIMREKKVRAKEIENLKIVIPDSLRPIYDKFLMRNRFSIWMLILCCPVYPVCFLSILRSEIMTHVRIVNNGVEDYIYC